MIDPAEVQAQLGVLAERLNEEVEEGLQPPAGSERTNSVPGHSCCWRAGSLRRSA